MGNKNLQGVNFYLIYSYDTFMGMKKREMHGGVLERYYIDLVNENRA